jgi:hypothetical protein
MDINAEVKAAIEQARNAAHQAATNYFHEVMRGKDNYPCGFAWVKVYEKGNTKLGRALLKNGFSKSYSGGLEMWNPSGLPYQNVDVKEAGAEAAAKVLNQLLGVKAYAGSRLD